VTSFPRPELPIVHWFRDFLLTELPPRFSHEMIRVLQARALPMSSEIERDVAEVCRKEMFDVSARFLSMLQVASQEPRQPVTLTSEATSATPLSSPAGDSAVMAPWAFATNDDSTQSSSEWSSWSHGGSHHVSDSFSTQPPHAVSSWSQDGDAGAGFLNFGESNTDDTTQADSFLYRF
jgi:hypothetical protein